MSHERPRHRLADGLFLREYGTPGPRPPLLFVHGLGESGLCFEELAAREELAERWRLVPDLPGYGRSTWPDEPLPLEAVADQLAGWIVRELRRPATVVGHSMGGVLAVLLAERAPEQVAAVVDVDGNVSLEDCVFSGRAARDSFERFESLGFSVLRRAVYQEGRESKAQRGYYASLRLADPAVFHQHSLDLLRLSRPEDMAGRLAALAQPALYIAGDPNGACPRSRELLAGSGARCAAIGPSGHWPFIDQPDAFVSALTGFLAEQEL